MSITANNPVCKASLKLLGDFWTMLIVDCLSDGPLRFKELERKMDSVNTATLSSRLKNMQTAGLIDRIEASRADVSYELTDLGRQAIPVLEAMDKFATYSTAGK